MTTIQEIERAINDLGYGTPEYHEALAFYFLTLARAQWRMADQIHVTQMKQQRRRRSTARDDHPPGEV